MTEKKPIGRPPSIPDYETYEATPPVGWAVQWFNRGLPDSDPIAAICTAIEEPGRIKLYTTRPNAVPVSINGCYHIGNPRHEKHTETSQRNGGWDFIPGHKPRDPWEHVKRDRKRRALAQEQDAQARKRRGEAEQARIAEEKAELAAAS